MRDPVTPPAITPEEVAGLVALADAQRDERARAMPTEADAIRAMTDAHHRLRELGWRDAVYCPKDGSSFDVVEPGSSGIHSAAYYGEWPTGGWWIDGEWPSRPTLYRPTEAELAKNEERRAAFRKHLLSQTARGEGL